MGWIQALFRRRRTEQILDDEIRHHLDCLEKDYEQRGLKPDLARRSAIRRFGNVPHVKERIREQTRIALVESVFQDLRYAARSLRRQPAFTALAVLSLVIAVGLNTTVFTSINTVMFRPWDAPDAGRLIKIFVDNRGSSILFQQYANAHGKTLDGAMFYTPFNAVLDGENGAAGQKTEAMAVSANYFDVLQVNMQIGRGFSLQDDTSQPAAVVVLSHLTWKLRYGGDNAILGRRVSIDGVAFTVLGVAPETFLGTTGRQAGFWIPPAAFRLIRPNEASVSEMLTDPDWCCVEIAARLAEGMSKVQAKTELEVLFNQFLREHRIPPRSAGQRRGQITVSDTGYIPPSRRQRAYGIFALLVGAVGSVLLLACANISNLQLARAIARRHEVSVRLAIGAGSGRIFRQMLTESLLLTSVAGSAGLAIAVVLPRAMLVPLNGEAALSNLRWTPDWIILGCTIALVGVSAVGCGLAPALWSTRVQPGVAMSGQIAQLTPRTRMHGVLLGTQIAISLALLICAGVLIRGLHESQDLDPGIRTAGLTVLRVELPVNAYNKARAEAFLHSVDTRLAPLGRIGFSRCAPLSNCGRVETARVGNRLSAATADVQWVNSEYLDLLEISVVTGRPFSSQDSNPALVNQALAGLHWPNQSPIGQLMVVDGVARQVVGVVRDAQISGIGPISPTVFLPAEEQPDRVHVYLLPETMARPGMTIIQQMEPRAIVTTNRLPELLNFSFQGLRTAARLVGALGLLALLVSATGVWGTVSYVVEQRRKELGIRMALGAKPQQAVASLLSVHLPACGIGLLAGILLAMIGSRAIENQLFGVRALDPIAYAGAFGLITLVGVLASVVPAVRAIRSDATEALRSQ